MHGRVKTSFKAEAIKEESNAPFLVYKLDKNQ
jgi:hypothetical protein